MDSFWHHYNPITNYSDICKENHYHRVLVFDLLVRLFITYSFYHSFHVVMNLDQYYEKFYARTIPLTFQKPDALKQIINILSAIFVGFCSGVFYNAIVQFFIPNIGGFSFIVSSLIGLSLLIPLLSQYQKR